jgi:hypothetical protein
MSEEKRSINIAYKADLKDLINKLKQMPNVTEQEARKMVSALDRQLKQAEKAAKKSADASAKAAKQASAAARRGAREFDDMADAARRAEERLEHVGEASGDIDRGFSSIGLALRGVNPQLAEAADGLADTFAVVEGLTMSFAALNPLVVAGGVAIGALTLGYVAHQAELEKVKEQTLALKDAQRALIDSQNEQENNLIDAASKLREQRLEYQLLTGQISEYEFNLQKAGEAANESFRGNIEAVQSSISESELLLATIQSLKDSYIAAGSSAVVLSEGEQERLRTLQLQTKSVKNNLDLTQEGLAEAAELGKLEKALLADIANQTKQREAIEAMQAEAVDKAQEMVTLEKELADATEEAATQSERRAVATERTLTAEEELAKALEEALALSDDVIKEKNLQSDMDRAIAEAFLDDEGRKKLAQQARIEEQIGALEMLGIATGREAEAAMAIEALRHEQKMENLDKEDETISDNIKKQLENAQLIQGGFSEMISGLQQLNDLKMESSGIDVEAAQKKAEMLEQLSAKERKQLEKRAHMAIALFKLEKAASIAEITMNTAEGVTKALTYGLPLGPILAGMAVATGATQAALVASQPIPQLQFHMGGIAPDEANARVLRGEAILDRATVRRMGGEQGVRNLQQGASAGSQTVVIQPFKHFGRFAKDLGIQKTKQVGIRGY